jgi:hypothetical protein
LPVDKDIAEFLTDEEVAEIVEMVSQAGPVIVGGQAVNIWAHYFDIDVGMLMVSRDIDFLGDTSAEDLLKSGLINARKVVTTGDDATPNSAVVIGDLHGRQIVVDFLNSVAGVESARARRDPGSSALIGRSRGRHPRPACATAEPSGAGRHAARREHSGIISGRTAVRRKMAGPDLRRSHERSLARLAKGTRSSK